KLGFILDRGYFSRDNIEYMDTNEYEFIIMVKGCKALIVGYYTLAQCKEQQVRKVWLIVMSVIFCGYSSIHTLLIVTGSIVFNNTIVFL
ncbi:MAG: hypothetical protein R3Y54_11520, partial [Eubacteriales bacterium]